MIEQKGKDEGHGLLLRYVGLAIQLLISLGAALFIGMWVDKKFDLPVPIFPWVLPLLVLISLLINVIKDTSRKK